MNRKEKKLLFALYQHLQSPGIWRSYSPLNLDWVSDRPIMEIRKQFVVDDDIPNVQEGSETETQSRVEPMLRYLEGKTLVSLDWPASGVIDVSLTVRGIEYAREYETMFGRMQLWYRAHKEGLLGLIITFLLAVLTSLVTASLYLYSRS